MTLTGSYQTGSRLIDDDFGLNCAFYLHSAITTLAASVYDKSNIDCEVDNNDHRSKHELDLAVKARRIA